MVFTASTRSAKDVRNWVAERLAGYKVPTYVNFQPEVLVKNATGKILKKQIRQAYLDSLERYCQP